MPAANFPFIPNGPSAPASTATKGAQPPAADTPAMPMPTSRAQYLRLIWSVAAGEFKLDSLQFRALQYFGKINGWHTPPKPTEEPEEVQVARAELLRTLAARQASAPQAAAPSTADGDLAAQPAQAQRPCSTGPTPPHAPTPHAAPTPPVAPAKNNPAFPHGQAPRRDHVASPNGMQKANR